MSRKAKNFFYRIDPEQIISEIFPMRGSERGKWLIQFLFDLRNDDEEKATSDIAKLIIQEAKNYRNSKVTAGRASAEKRATTVQHRPNKKQQRSNKSQPETETETETEHKLIYADDVTLFKSEYEKLIADHGAEKTIWMINKLSSYKGSKGKKYKSDYKAILTWVIEEAAKNFKPTFLPELPDYMTNPAYDPALYD